MRMGYHRFSVVSPIRSICELDIASSCTADFVHLLTTLKRDYPFLKSFKCCLNGAWPIKSDFPAIEKIPLHHLSLEFNSCCIEPDFHDDLGMVFDLFPIARNVDIGPNHPCCTFDDRFQHRMARTISAYICSYQSSPHTRCGLSLTHSGMRMCDVRMNNSEEDVTVMDAAAIDRVLGPVIVRAIQQKSAWVQSVRRYHCRTTPNRRHVTFIRLEVRLGNKQFDISLSYVAE